MDLIITSPFELYEINQVKIYDINQFNILAKATNFLLQYTYKYEYNTLFVHLLLILSVHNEYE